MRRKTSVSMLCHSDRFVAAISGEKGEESAVPSARGPSFALLQQVIPGCARHG
jgi:hypothetical protein